MKLFTKKLLPYHLLLVLIAAVVSALLSSSVQYAYAFLGVLFGLYGIWIGTSSWLGGTARIMKKDALTFLPLLLLGIPLLISFPVPSHAAAYSSLPTGIILILGISLSVFFKARLVKKKTPSLPRWSPWLIILLFFIIFSTLSVLRHANFHSAAYDLGIYDQVVWGYSQGEIIFSTLDRAVLLADHVQPILFAIAPLYALFKTPVILLLVQTLAIALSGIPVFRLAKKYLKEDFLALLVLLSFFLYPSVQYPALLDFHPLVLALPFILWALHDLLAKNYKRMTLFLVLAGLCKEYVPLLMVTFGLYLLLKRKWKWGASLIAVGFLWFFLNFQVIMPFFSGGSYLYLSESRIGASFGEMITNGLLHPIWTAQQLLVFTNISFIMLLLIPLGFGLLALGAPLILLLGIIELLIIMVWSLDLFQVAYHHQISIVPFVVVSTILGIGRLKKWKKPAVFFVLSTSLLSLIVFGPFTLLYHGDTFQEDPDYVQAGREALALIPPETSVTTLPWIAPHLSSRSYLFILPGPQEYKGYYYVPDTLPKQAEYVVLDLSDSLGNPALGSDSVDFADINEIVNNPDYGLIFMKNSWAVLKRGSLHRPCDLRGISSVQALELRNC